MKISEYFGNNIYSAYKEPYIIAEIGVNHGGDYDLAKHLVYLAREGGANAAKFQTYKSNRLASKNSPSYWDLNKEKCESQFELFKKYDGLNRDDYERLAEYCKSIEIDFATTPFDNQCLEWLDKLLLYTKVASADITNKPLLEAIARLKKPVLLSTGAANFSEIEAAINVIRKNGSDNICLLHCVLNYPTENKNAQLGGVIELSKRFPDCLIGYSDHTLPQDVLPALEAAYLLGAPILEKHFTHDKSLPGNDHYHAMDKDDLIRFRHRISMLREMIGNHDYKNNLNHEFTARMNARRSIVAAKEIPIGKIIDESDLDFKRPGFGVSPMDIELVVGKKSKKIFHVDDLIHLVDLY